MGSVSGASSQEPKFIAKREDISRAQENNSEGQVSKKRSGLRAIFFSKFGLPSSVKSLIRRPNEVKPTNSEGNRTVWSGSNNVGSPAFLAELSGKDNDGHVSGERRMSEDLFDQPFAEACPDDDDPNNIQIYKDLDFDEILNINGYVSPKVPEKVSYRNIPPLKPHMFGDQRNAGNDLGLPPLPPRPPIPDKLDDVGSVDSFFDDLPNINTEGTNENNNDDIPSILKS
ncbi:hypothetical protein ACJJIL_09720 [Microbulbifer sp. EKSA005]|uniref:hypothetical protein n=1 Tax=Microbulbifer sp. EKSA005 TaxID=3243364 RepID=UPI0040418F57